MQTMDTVAQTPSGAMTSPAAERNGEAILTVLSAHLPARGRVLEVAAGSGQHAVAFARALPGIDWIPSDPSETARASIAAWRGSAGLANLHAPLALDVEDDATWPHEPVSAVVAINMVHISPWSATLALIAGARQVLAPAGLLFLYGPYLERDVETAPSNLAFDQSLKARNPAWGLRDRDAVAEAARAQGLVLSLRTAMPANNLALLFRRT